MPAQATSKNVRVSAKKVKRIVDTIRGRKVEEALSTLQFMPSPTAREVAKAVKSAAANAENNLMIAPSDLRIVAIYANQGVTLKLFRARARGRASRILKRSTHITVVVDEEGV